MKRTFWRPLLLGTISGAVAGIAMASGLSFLTTGITQNAIGFYFTLLLLNAALGGPIAVILAVPIWLAIARYFGPADMRSILSEPTVFWTNLLVLIILLCLISLGYRLIFERFKMPIRLLPWAGMVAAFYIINPLILITVQFLLNDEDGIISALFYTYGTYFGQAIFDIVTTSLIFIALPVSYTRPLWYEPGQPLKLRS